MKCINYNFMQLRKFARSAHPHGSRRIQRALETATHEEVVMVYREVIPVARRLSTDVFGNYAIQKLLERGPLRCQMEFISELIGHVVPLSHHIYGCRVIQKVKLIKLRPFCPLLLLLY
jgi:pumilio RNA-binding family